MSLCQFNYPGIFQAAERESGKYQKCYLFFIIAEYSFLIIASTLTSFFNANKISELLIVTFILLALISSALRYHLRHEQEWYGWRAVSESIKTSCWRFAMKAEPYEDDKSANTQFAEQLMEIIKTNRFAQNGIHSDAATNEQIPDAMRSIRILDVQQRLKYYCNFRISEQQEWYKKKSLKNNKMRRCWIIIGGFSYFLLIILLLIGLSSFSFLLFSTDPLLVWLSFIVGWTQIKRFAELSTSYSLAAYEIGIVKTKANEVSDEETLSEFVNDAEQAFSREHTQWTARKQRH